MYLDDTTTTFNSMEEDKTLLLDGKERLKYFADQPVHNVVHKPLHRPRHGLLSRLLNWIRH